jgi:hypothetical protein
MVYTARMIQRPRILVVGDTAADMRDQILLQCLPEENAHVVLADTYRRLERLVWRTKRRWSGRPTKVPRLFDVACIDANSDLRNLQGQSESPIRHAVGLAENGTSVLMYSPLYTGLRLQTLEDMVGDEAFIGVFNPQAIPEAAALYLQEPQTAKRLIMLLKVMRWASHEALQEKKALQGLLARMNQATRELCMHILSYEEEHVRPAFP